MFGLENFDNLLSSWPFFQVQAYLVFGLFSNSFFSKIQNLAFFTFKLLATLVQGPLHGTGTECSRCLDWRIFRVPDCRIEKKPFRWQLGPNIVCDFERRINILCICQSIYLYSIAFIKIVFKKAFNNFNNSYSEYLFKPWVSGQILLPSYKHVKKFAGE